MKRCLCLAIVALALSGVVSSQAKAICFDVYQPCIRLALPRLPIILPKISVGCEPCMHAHAKLAFNRSCAPYGGFGGGHGAAQHGNGCWCAYPLGCGVDCNRPLYPNPGAGWNGCAYGAAGPWYNYFPPMNGGGGGGGVPSYWYR